MKSLGKFITLKKSLVVKPSPNPNIINAKTKGTNFVAISIYLLA